MQPDRKISVKFTPEDSLHYHQAQLMAATLRLKIKRARKELEAHGMTFRYRQHVASIGTFTNSTGYCISNVRKSGA